jgi:hypothetical protein
MYSKDLNSGGRASTAITKQNAEFLWSTRERGGQKTVLGIHVMKLYAANIVKGVPP